MSTGPSAPLIVQGFYIERQSALSELCALLARQPDIEVGEEAEFVAPSVEFTRLAEVDLVVGRLDDPRGELARVALRTEVGPGLAQLGPTRPGHPHPVEVVASAGALGLPPSTRSPDDEANATAVARWVLCVFRTVCETLDPLYAAITMHRWLPSPPELREGVPLGTEVYVANGLSVRLDELFLPTTWRTGTFYSGWAPFNDAGTTVSTPQSRSSTAARLLGTAIPI